MVGRKTVKKGGLFGMFSGPTRNPAAEVFTASNGIQISKSKSRDLIIYSKDGGKTWNYGFNKYIPGYEKQSPPDVHTAEIEYAVEQDRQKEINWHKDHFQGKTGIYAAKTPEQEAAAKIKYQASLRSLGVAAGGKKRKTRKHKRRT